MKITGLFWLDSLIDKLARKHGVLPHEVEEVLFSRPHVRFIEKGQRTSEDLYAAYGRAHSGRKLTVFFIRKKAGMALIISAREMTASEWRSYGKA